MEQKVKEIFRIIAISIEVFGGFVIITSAFYSIYRYFRKFTLSVRDPGSVENVRLKLGKSLSLGLDFLIAADILKTLITPTLREISILAAIIAIRVVLNFFLEREMAQVKGEAE